MKQYAVLFFVLISSVAGNDCDASKCLKVPQHYLELGCTPVKDSNQCCTERFDCPARKKLDGGQCDFKNVIYKQYDSIPDEIVNYPCTTGCFCSDGNVTCAIEECPEFLGTSNLKCIKQHSPDSCCQGLDICDEAKKAKLATCKFEGKTYRGGQLMYSNVDKCKRCSCEEGFDGKLDSKFCQTMSCGIELQHNKELTDGCAPSYFGNDKCCPTDWRCPESTDAVVPGTQKSGEDPALVCKFGNLTLRRGDSLTQGTNKCTTKCTCLIPPMVTCTTDVICIQIPRI